MHIEQTKAVYRRTFSLTLPSQFQINIHIHIQYIHTVHTYSTHIHIYTHMKVVTHKDMIHIYTYT